MHTIENEFLRVLINPVGAELTSLFNKSTNREYLWSGDPAFWGKKSPVLFPVVGTLRDNTYLFEDKTYSLNRHGFGREKTFKETPISASSILFQLSDDDNTRQVFPFEFNFSLVYALAENRLSVTYLVSNKGASDMYFSVGAHPAFKLPIVPELGYEDYYLVFNNIENADRWPISPDGLIEKESLPLLNNTQLLPLSKELFYKDAIVFKNLVSDEVQLKSDRHPSGLNFSFKGFPYLGIWAAKDADFICIEPWCGIADSVNTNQLFNEKEGIVQLPSGEAFERTWSVATF